MPSVEKSVVVPWAAPQPSLAGAAAARLRRLFVRGDASGVVGEAEGINGHLVLRAYACMLVVVLHTFGSLGPKAWPNLLTIGSLNLTWLVHTPAWAGVWIFFTLSGFLMGKAFFSHRYALDRAGVIGFYHNRAWRILPLYYLVVAISCLFETPIVFERAHWSVLFRMVTFTYAGQGNVNPNGALWSLSTEVQFYVLAPFMAGLAMQWFASADERRWKQSIAAIAALTATGLCLRAGVWQFVCGADMRNWASNIYKPIWMNLDLFGLGLLMNVFTTQKRRESATVVPSEAAQDLSRARRHTVIAAAALVGCNLMLGYFTWTGFTLGRSPASLRFFVIAGPTCIALMTCATIVAIERVHAARKLAARTALRRPANVATWLSATVVHRPGDTFGAATPSLAPPARPSIFTSSTRAVLRLCEHAGHLTYGIYVWHALVLGMAAVRIFPGESSAVFWQRLGFVALLVCLLSELTYRIVEQPAESHKRLSAPGDRAPPVRAAA